MGGQHGELAHDQRQFPIAGLVEGETHLVVRQCFGLGDVGIVAGIMRMVGGERLERENHVRCGHRLAVMPARNVVEVEFDPAEILRIGHRLRHQAVFGARLVHRIRHQRVVDESDRARLPLHDEWVEAVKGAIERLAQAATLRRIGVHIVEMGEVGGIFRLADQRQAVGSHRLLRVSLRHGGQRQRHAQ